MVVPMFKEDYESKSLKELVEARQKLIKEMKKYEDEFILEKTKKNDLKIKIAINPSPDVFWSVNNTNLIMLTELIEEKRFEEE